MRSKGLENSTTYHILIATFCLNFLGRGSIFCLVFSAFALFLLRKTSLSLDNCGLVVFLFSVSAIIAAIVHFGVLEAVKCVNFILVYLIGYNGYRTATNKKGFILKTVSAVFCGFSVLLIMTFFYNINFDDGGYRIIQNVWTGELIAVTLIGLLTSVIIGFSFYAIFLEKRTWVKVVAAVVLIISMILNMQTATRTPFLLLGIVYFYLFIVIFKERNFKINKRLLLILTACALLLAVLIALNVFGIRDRILSTAIVNRFFEEGFESGRMKIVVLHFQNMFKHLFGGNKISTETGRMAHNFIQQGHDMYGIFATAFLVILCISFIKKIVFFTFKKNKDGTDYLILGVYLSMLIQSFMEPVFTGYPCFMFAFLLIHGMVNKYVKEEKKLSN